MTTGIPINTLRGRVTAPPVHFPRGKIDRVRGQVTQTQHGPQGGNQPGPDGPRASVPQPRSYHNLNFILLRIILANILSPKASNAAPPWVTPTGHVKNPTLLPPDPVGIASESIGKFDDYIHDRLFNPTGVAAGLKAPDGHAFLYLWPAVSGRYADLVDISGGCGSAGWWMSLRGMLRAAGAARRAGTLLSAQQAEDAIAQGLGWDDVSTREVGVVALKGGLAIARPASAPPPPPDPPDDFLYECRHGTALIVLPRGMEIGLVVNSNVFFDGVARSDIVRMVVDSIDAATRDWNPVTGFG